MYECIYLIPGGSTSSGTLEGWAEDHPSLFEQGSRLDGVGYLTVPCDGISPEMAAAAGCTPVTTMDRVY